MIFSLVKEQADQQPTLFNSSEAQVKISFYVESFAAILHLFLMTQNSCNIQHFMRRSQILSKKIQQVPHRRPAWAAMILPMFLIDSAVVCGFQSLYWPIKAPNRPKIRPKLLEGGLPATLLAFEKVSATKNMRDYVEKGFILDLLSDLAYRGLNRPK